KVGLRLDHSWRAYYVVVGVWEELLRRDGAEPHVLWTGERVGAEGVTTRSDLDEWSRLVDCGVVGPGHGGSCTSRSGDDTRLVDEPAQRAVRVVHQGLGH